MVPRGVDGGRDSQGVWDGRGHTAVFNMENQQGPVGQHRELCSVSRGSRGGRGVFGRMATCIWMAESLCCPLETMTRLLISYASLQNKKFNTGGNRGVFQEARKKERCVSVIATCIWAANLFPASSPLLPLSSVSLTKAGWVGSVSPELCFLFFRFEWLTLPPARLRTSELCPLSRLLGSRMIHSWLVHHVPAQT